MPPYVIASDRTLREIAALRPSNLRELELAHGIGPAKREKYGAGLLAAMLGARAP
jgi:ATP-dependent DNA helicase RecQ